MIVHVPGRAVDVEVRLAKPDEQLAVEAMSKQFKVIRNDFAYIWRRFRNWELSPPIVALAGGEVVGFHAAVYGSPAGYVNSMYQAVRPDFQGLGLGGRMVEHLLAVADESRLDRLKFKTGFDSPGQVFWGGFGLQPFGFQLKPYKNWLYDVCIIGIMTGADLREKAGPKSGDWRAIPEKSLRSYERHGVKFVPVKAAEEA